MCACERIHWAVCRHINLVSILCRLQYCDTQQIEVAAAATTLKYENPLIHQNGNKR